MSDTIKTINLGAPSVVSATEEYYIKNKDRILGSFV